MRAVRFGRRLGGVGTKDVFTVYCLSREDGEMVCSRTRGKYLRHLERSSPWEGSSILLLTRAGVRGQDVGSTASTLGRGAVQHVKRAQRKPVMGQPHSSWAAQVTGRHPRRSTLTASFTTQR